MIKFQMIGRTTKDAEESAYSNTGVVVRLTIAVNRRRGQDQEQQADFFNVTAFGKTAETLSRLNIKQGTKLYLSGEIQNNNYTDKNGVKHYSDSYIIREFEFCESKKAENGANNRESGNSRGNYQTYEQAMENAPNIAQNDGFLPIPDAVDDDYLPFV